MNDQETQAKYGQAIHKLLAEERQSKIVEVEGVEILVSQPDAYRHFRLVNLLDQGAIDDLDYAVALVRLSVPGRLNEEMALKLLLKDGYPSGQCKILEAIAEFKTAFDDLKLDESAEAGKTPEAASDFSSADNSESE